MKNLISDCREFKSSHSNKIKKYQVEIQRQLKLIIVKSMTVDYCNKCTNKKIKGHFLRCAKCNYNVCAKCSGLKAKRGGRIRPSNKLGL